ncbi:MAG: PilN domain-containing protein [Longimicrobiales bacterium]
MPKFGGGGGGGGGGLPADPYILGAVVAGLVSASVIAWLFLGVGRDREETQVALDEAVQDSVRFADIIERTNALTARRDSIAQRVAIIQEIDADRYVWPHILDEVARALPDYTWLRELVYLGTDPLQVRISGRAGSTFAITNFMRQLEASPFLRGVVLERSEQAQSESGNRQDIIYQFDMTVNYEPPPVDELQSVPLFDDVSTQVAAPDSVGD